MPLLDGIADTDGKKGPPPPRKRINADESERIIITPVITDDIFVSFLKCPTKSYLESSKCTAVLNETIDWHAHLEQSYRARGRARLASKFEVPEPLSGTSCIEELKSGRYPLLID